MSESADRTVNTYPLTKFAGGL